MRYSSGARFSRAKPAGSFRVYHPSSRRVASHTDTLREARTDAAFWSKQTPNPIEIQERFPSGEWVTVETVKPKVPMTKITTSSKRSHSTMKEDRLHEAQLYWDDQDPKNKGWWLRYRDARGLEQGTAIEADEDATIKQLVAAIEAESHWLPGNGKIKMFRGEQPRGSITLTDGKVSDWRAR